jgi:hypothetical protein
MPMRCRANDLESRLVEWGKEYGGGKYEDVGWHGYSPLITLMTYHGQAPQGLNPRTSKDRTPADDVEDAITTLASQQGGWHAANIIRAEYTLSGKPVDAKIQILRSLKPPVHVSGRARYSQLLQIGRVHVAAWLHIAFSEVPEEPERMC